MQIHGDRPTTVKTSHHIKRQLDMVSTVEDRHMYEVGAEAIALYVVIDRDVRRELGFETNGELISAAVDEYIEKRGLDQ